MLPLLATYLRHRDDAALHKAYDDQAGAALANPTFRLFGLSSTSTSR